MRGSIAGVVAAPVLVLVLGSLVACDGELGQPGCTYVDVGECAPPAASAPLDAPVIELVDGCFSHWTTGLVVVDSAAAWDAELGTCMQPPAAVDFATHRLALVTVYCTPTDLRFVAETATEIVIGVHETPGGACIETPVLLALPRSSKPVRVASCRETGQGDCPPLA